MLEDFNFIMLCVHMVGDLNFVCLCPYVGGLVMFLCLYVWGHELCFVPLSICRGLQLHVVMCPYGGGLELLILGVHTLSL